MKKAAIAIIILALIGGGFYFFDKLATSSNNNSNPSTSANSNSNSQMQNTNSSNNNNNNNNNNVNENTSSSTSQGQTTQSNSNNTQNSASSVTRVSNSSSNNVGNQSNSSSTSNNLSNSNQNQGVTVNQIPQGYGNFGDLVESSNQEAVNSMPNGPMFLLLSIPINNQNISLEIDVTNVNYDGNILILKGHYLNKPFEQFTYYVSNTCDKPIDGPHKNPEYTMYEFYDGVNTAIFKLNFQGAAIYGGLTGTFEHVGSKQIYQCSGPFINPNGPGITLNKLPYYNGYINSTKVSLAATSKNNIFKEKYVNDTNIFTVTQVSMPDKFKKYNYQYALEESFNGKATGLYLVTAAPNTNDLNGIFLHGENGNFSMNNYSPVHLVPSVSPTV